MLEVALVELEQLRSRVESLDDEKSRGVLDQMALQDVVEGAQYELKRLQAEASHLRGEYERQGAELARARKEAAEKEASLDYVRRNGQALQQRSDEEEAIIGELRALVKEQVAKIQQLKDRSAEVDREMASLMMKIAKSMEQCITDVAAVAEAGWRLPQDRLQRLTKVLSIWHEWGAGRPRAVDAAQEAGDRVNERPRPSAGEGRAPGR